MELNKKLNRNNMKKLLFIIAFTIPYLAVQSQISEQVISASGGNGNNENLSIEWTVGEPVISTLLNESMIVTQGFHQPVLEVTPLKTPTELLFTIEAYPNPTQDLIWIKLDDNEIEGLQFLLHDVYGKSLVKNPFNSNTESVNMSAFPAGVYFLKIIQSDQEIKTFRIIKH